MRARNGQFGTGNRSLEEIEMKGQNLLKILATVAFVSFMAVACGKQEETPAPQEGVDTTMTETAPDTTGIAAPDTTGNM